MLSQLLSLVTQDSCEAQFWRCFTFLPARGPALAKTVEEFHVQISDASF